MNYILKQYDNDLLYFSMKNTNDGLEVLINTDYSQATAPPIA